MTVRTAPPLSDARQSSFGSIPFDTLDDCHQEMQEMLGDLSRLITHVQTHGVDETACVLARRTHLFFTTVAVNHHVDEERHVFPALLRNATPQLRSTLLHLQQEHTWLEAHWIIIAPRLDSLARGYQWHDLSEMSHHIARFTKLYRHHIDLEESLIYPPARAQLTDADLRTMSHEMAARRNKGRATKALDDRDNEDD